MDVDGIGAVVEPIPPIATVYQSNPTPFAVSAGAVNPWQYVNMLLFTMGAAGSALTEIDPLVVIPPVAVIV